VIEPRYGVFLRPDPATCWNVTQVTYALKQQFGLVSAGAFPPHATLVGNLATEATDDALVAVLNPVFEKLRTFPVFNSGIVRATGYEYNVNLDALGSLPNEPLNRLAREVKETLLPLSTPVEDYRVTPVADYEFAGHLGLASHELAVDDSLADQIGEFLHELPIQPPPRVFDARWYSLFEFTSDWNSRWWETMTWRHVHSWKTP
jgi:hypothetical protein